LTGRFRRAGSIVLADYRGLNVAQITDLRKRARQAGVEFRVIKNTLAAHAAEAAGVGALGPQFKGPTAVALGYGDLRAPARLLLEFGRVVRALEIKAGLAEGRLLNAAEVRALAMLPGREVLLGQVLAGVRSPLVRLATVLRAPLRSLASVLDELRKQREQAAD
jgi:large subunit ribosomal protein L10